MKNNKTKIIAIIAILMIIIALLFHFTHNNSPKSNGVLWNGKQTIKKEYEQSSISIPGFNEMTFVSNSLDQKVNLYNPENNDCTMNFSITMPDGSVIWEENNVQPGYGLYDIQINKKLEKGIYEGCILAVRCFKDDVELNGGNITFILYVQ